MEDHPQRREGPLFIIVFTIGERNKDFERDSCVYLPDNRQRKEYFSGGLLGDLPSSRGREMQAEKKFALKPAKMKGEGKG